MSAMFACTALVGTSKVGKLTADSNGYYTVVLGALNFHNASGAFYELEGAKKLFEDSSDFMRRVTRGNLRGEYGHPKFLPGMTKRDFFMRVCQVYEENVSHHISKVWLEEGVVKDRNGNGVVAIMGLVKPSGPKGQYLAEQLENTQENVCFSIRSLTNDMTVNGKLIKVLKEIMTWDYVDEPGLHVAEKYSSPSLESFCDMRITRETALAARDYMESLSSNGVSMESSRAIVDNIIQKMDWERSNVSGLVLPPSARWGQ